MVTLNLRDDCNGRVATNFKRGMTDKRFLELEITAWLTSPERKKQLEGEAYYDGYQDVTHRERLALDEDGKPIVLKNLPNNRLVNNLYSKMVDQKTNYSFAPTPFAASVSLSISFLVRVLTAFLAVMHLTLPPASIAPVNTPKPHFATTSLRSVISIA